jgi:hypothetical protein
MRPHHDAALKPQRRFLTFIFVACLSILPASARAQSNIEKIKTGYAAVSAKLEKHLVHGAWLDDDPESPKLLALQWSLAGEWVAAWLNAHPHAGPAGVKAAIAELSPSSIPQYLALNTGTFLVVSPSPVGNLFIVSKSGDGYRLAWSTAQRQETSGKSAEVLAAWRPENARSGARGPYWAASGSAGSIVPVHLGILASDAKGRVRFYIEGIYAQMAGGTVGAQTSLWVWDGVTARPQLTRDYALMIDQKVGARMEGGLFKVQQKRSFRTFFSCGECEERQTDWLVRLTPDGIEDLGEKSAVPELDAVDELFYRVINHKSAADVAAPAAVEAAKALVECARRDVSDQVWKKFPSLGMMGDWSVTRNKNAEDLCLELDNGGTNIFKLRPVGEGFFITSVTKTDSCSRHSRDSSARL